MLVSLEEMYPNVVRVNRKAALLVVSMFFAMGVQQSQTSKNLDLKEPKTEIYKIVTTSNGNATVFMDTDTSNCPTDSDCNALNFPCIICTYNYSCIYGKEVNITCDASVSCKGEKKFTRAMNCRYCYQTAPWEHVCIQKGNCDSVNQNAYYRTNCTAKYDVLCLGNRQFSKNLKCNWTQGYKWSTALIISLTLGGFGVDRWVLVIPRI